jgi:hypothetical protein
MCYELIFAVLKALIGFESWLWLLIIHDSAEVLNPKPF